MRAIFDAVRLYPHTCVWEITARCNFRCLHCASGLGPVSIRGCELDTTRALRLCDELAELGCRYAVLSGGEPLLRDDWPELMRRLHSRGVQVGMISNGWLVTDSAVAEMVRSGLSILAVSVDGLAETHDRIRRRPGSFVAATRALARARAAGLRTHAVTHVNRLNRPELGGMLAQLESLGVSTWLLQLSAPMGRLGAHPELVLRPDELPALTDWLAANRPASRLNIAVGDNIGYFTGKEALLRSRPDGQNLGFWCGCSAGCFTIGIEANGNVKGCLSLQSDDFIEGNIARTDLRSIWERPGAFAYTRNFDVSNLAGYCAKCAFGEVCRGGCTFMSVATSGKPGNNRYCLHRLEQEA